MSSRSDLRYDLTGAGAIAEVLGFKRGKIYALVKNRQIPAVRIGGVIYARRSVLVEWVERQEKKACENTTA